MKYLEVIKINKDQNDTIKISKQKRPEAPKLKLKIQPKWT